MTITDISLPGLNFTRSQEGRSTRAYQDTTGVWTIGYGVTNFDKGIGFKVAAGVTITPEEAEWLLIWTIRKNYLPDVMRALNDQSKLAKPQGAIDGGVDMHYNTGGILKSTWPRLLMAGNLTAAKASLESWNRGGGRVLSDLVRRRAGEWLEISAENYGFESGPANVTVSASGREIGEHGSGGLLTSYPTDPNGGGAVKPTATTGAPLAGAPAAPGALVVGSTGPAVTALQDNLTAQGIPTPPTGTFDATTKASVEAFQGAHPQLTKDGTVGPATSAALRRAADLKVKAASVGKYASGAPVAAASLWHFAYTNSAEIVIVTGVVFTVAGLGYVAYKYRHEIMALLNKARGKIVP